MFNNTQKLEKRIKELETELEDVTRLKSEIKELENSKRILKDELADLKSKKKVEEEQIEHLSKIRDEKREIEFKKKELGLKDEMRKEIAEVKDGFQDKQIEMLNDAKKDLQEIYTKIMERLPNVEAMVNIGDNKNSE